MELHDALSQIAEIRRQMARAEVFQGYKAAPVAMSGCLAVAAGVGQSLWISEPLAHLEAYLGLWITAAALSLVATFAVLTWQYRGSSGSLRREITWLAVTQFLPCLLAGGAVTLVIARGAPASSWMLPGLWQLFFSLGIFASYRLLPRAILWVGVFYMSTGSLLLAAAQEEWALAPWSMAVPFGIGQLATAAILYWTLERNDGQSQA